MSQATVSRVLTATIPVSSAKRAAVRAAMAHLGHRPNAFARSLATNRSRAIGTLVSELSSAVYGDIIRGIDAVVEECGLHMVVPSGHARSAVERNSFAFLEERRTDALIVQVDATSDDELVTWACNTELPVVVGRHIPAIAARCVYLDNVAGGALATRHLLERDPGFTAVFAANERSAAGATPPVVYLGVPLPELERRLAARNAALPAGTSVPGRATRAR